MEIPSFCYHRQEPALGLLWIKIKIKIQVGPNWQWLRKIGSYITTIAGHLCDLVVRVCCTSHCLSQPKSLWSCKYVSTHSCRHLYVCMCVCLHTRINIHRERDRGREGGRGQVSNWVWVSGLSLVPFRRATSSRNAVHVLLDIHVELCTWTELGLDFVPSYS